MNAAMTKQQVAEFCRSLPGVKEDVKWGGVEVFYIDQSKMFALFNLNSNGLSFKVEKELFLGYVDRPGIRPSPYLARAYWINMQAPTRWAHKSYKTCCAVPTSWWSASCRKYGRSACSSDGLQVQKSDLQEQHINPHRLVCSHDQPEPQLIGQLAGFVAKHLLRHQCAGPAAQ